MLILAPYYENLWNFALATYQKHLNLVQVWLQQACLVKSHFCSSTAKMQKHENVIYFLQTFYMAKIWWEMAFWYTYWVSWSSFIISLSIKNGSNPNLASMALGTHCALSVIYRFIGQFFTQKLVTSSNREFSKIDRATSQSDFTSFYMYPYQKASRVSLGQTLLPSLMAKKSYWIATKFLQFRQNQRNRRAAV